MSEAAPRRLSRGSSGGHRKCVGPSWGFAQRPVDLSVEGALGSKPRGVGALREVGVLGASGLARFGGPARRRDRERQRYVRPARALPNKRAPVCCTPFSVAAPSREDETYRSWRPRRTIAALPGVGCAGNSTPASATSSPLSARVSARVMRRRTKRRAESRKRQARGSGDRWVLVTISRLQRSQKGISHRPAGALLRVRGGTTGRASRTV